MRRRLSSIEAFKRELRGEDPKKVEEGPKTKKKPAIFELVNHMAMLKTPWDKLSDELQDVAKNQYYYLKWLSTFEEYLPVLNCVSQMELSDKDFYTLMCNTLRRQRHYFNSDIYKKKEDPDPVLIRALELEFFLSTRKARVYAEELTPEELESIKKKWEYEIANEPTE